MPIDAARPEWFLVGVFEFSHLFPGGWAIVPIFIVPGLLVCLLLAMPFLAQRTVGHVFNVVFTVALLIAVVSLSYYSLAKDRDDPAHQKAIAVEKWQADRVFELARHEGIPPTGALALLRGDPKVEGRRLFIQYCASCHNHGMSGDDAPIGEDIWIGPIDGAESLRLWQPPLDCGAAGPEANCRPTILRQHEAPQEQDGHFREG